MLMEEQKMKRETFAQCLLCACNHNLHNHRLVFSYIVERLYQKLITSLMGPGFKPGSS